VSDRRASAAALLRVVAAGTCWGLAAVWAKVAFEHGVAPVRLAEARVLIALVVLFAILWWWRREQLRLPRGALAALVAFGLCVAGVNGTYYVAIDRLPVGVAVSIQFTAPVILLALAALRWRGAGGPGRLAWAAAALTLTGAILVSRAAEGLHGVDRLGLLAAAASAFLFAGYLLSAGAAGRRGVPAATVLLWGFVVALVAWSVVAPWWSWPYSVLNQPKVAISVLAVGLVGTLVPFFLAVGAVRVLSPATAGIAASVEPPAAAFLAWVFLGQHLTAVQIVGGALVVMGVILAHRTAALSPEALSVEASP